MKRKIAFGLFAAVCLVAAGALTLAVSAQSRADDRVPGQYIVVLNDSIADSDAAGDDLSRRHGFVKEQSFRHAIKGFTAALSPEKLAKLKSDSRVAFVSEDHYVTAFDLDENGALGNAKNKPSPSAQPAQVTPTGVKRVNAPANTNKGAGIGVAIVDTGIDLTHPDLAANIIANTTCVSGTTTGKDDNGHGSHVAGTVAALNNTIGVVGVAPEAKLLAVKVLNRNGSGTWSSVICGIDWVTANAAKYNIKVANMSLGGGGTSDNNCGNTNNDALHKAICRSRDAGVTYVVAAGNSGANASLSVPAAYNDAVITVSALADSDGKSGGLGAATAYGPDDTFATFSNFGSVVDIAGPGVNILSTWKGGGYNTISGTSMATPHVAGSAALYIKSHPGAAWSAVRDGLIAAGEPLGAGHTDPSGLHPEPVVQAGAL